jgi:hypothetical protein
LIIPIRTEEILLRVARRECGEKCADFHNCGDLEGVIDLHITEWRDEVGVRDADEGDIAELCFPRPGTVVRLDQAGRGERWVRALDGHAL